MIKSIIWGLGIGMFVAMWNYFFYVKIFPPKKSLKLNWVLSTVINASYLVFSGSFISLVSWRLTFLLDVQRGSANDYLSYGLMIMFYFFSLFKFLVLPVLYARGSVK